MGDPSDPHRRIRLSLTVVLTAASAALVPWTIYLAITLPRHYTASHWRLTWVGLDIVMSVFLARTAWLTHRRAYGPVVVSAVVAGTLLFVDAWFDVTTATGRADRLAALATAVFGEIPLALLLFWAAHRALNSPHRTPTAAPTATPAAATTAPRSPRSWAYRHDRGDHDDPTS